MIIYIGGKETANLGKPPTGTFSVGGFLGFTWLVDFPPYNLALQGPLYTNILITDIIGLNFCPTFQHIGSF